MALASQLSGHAGLRPHSRHHAWSATICGAGHSQQRRAPQHPHGRRAPSAHRRELVGTLFLGHIASQKTVAQAVASAVFHEVSVDISATTSSENEPLEDPPTRVKATGRVIASEWLSNWRLAASVCGVRWRARNGAETSGPRRVH